MGRVNLLGGTYEARSVIADAQRCVNLYPEINPGTDSDHPVTHYPTPGTSLLATGPEGTIQTVSVAATGSHYLSGNFSSVPLYNDSTFPVTFSSGQAYFNVDTSTGVPSLDLTRGSGYDAVGTYTSTAGDVTSVSISNGLFYNVGDYLTLLAPGNLSYLTVQVTAVSSQAASRCEYRSSDGQYFRVVGSSVYYVESSWKQHLIGVIGTSGSTPCSMSDNGVVAVLVDGSSKGYAIDLVSHSFGAITSPYFFGSVRADYLDTYFLFNKPDTTVWYISLSEVTYSVLTGVPGAVQSGTITAGGSAYSSGTFTGVTVTGGSGLGAIATVTVTSGAVTAITFTSNGQDYVIGDSLGIGATVATTTLTSGGTGYVSATYTSVPLTGGSGVDCVATVTVAAGIVTAVSITNGGIGYVVGDVLSASNAYLGGAGSGLQVTVATTAGTGFDYNISTIYGGGFDGLDYATKLGSPDPIQTIGVVHTEVWLIGQLTTEVWYNSGAAAFPFQRLPGTFVEHGTPAPYSLAKNDLNLFWLSQDRQGQAVVVKSANYAVGRISTHAIEHAISKYSTITDAIGYTYQQEGHVFYVLTFPTANATWVYDDTSGMWHQSAFTDSNGVLNRLRANAATFVYTDNVVGDYANGNIYQVNLDTSTDYVDGAGPNTDGSYPISRIRAFPHMMNDAKRVYYGSFIADMECGNDTGTADGSTPANPPVVSLRFSDDRGRTYGNAIGQSLGAAGQYVTSMRYNRLGYARDRVFELSWSAPARTALQGAFIEITPGAS